MRSGATKSSATHPQRAALRSLLSRLAFGVLTVIMICGAVYTMAHASNDAPPAHGAAAPHEQDQHGDPAPVKFSGPLSNGDTCLVDPLAIEDLRRKADDLAKRGQDLEAREKELLAKESALKDEVGKLRALRDEITQLEETKSKLNAGKVGKVVETVQGMSPRAAAKIMAELDDALAVSAAEQMDSAKLGKVLAAMEPSRSAHITQLMAGVVRAKKHASRDASATTPETKGGETQ